MVSHASYKRYIHTNVTRACIVVHDIPNQQFVVYNAEPNKPNTQRKKHPISNATQRRQRCQMVCAPVDEAERVCLCVSVWMRVHERWPRDGTERIYSESFMCVCVCVRVRVYQTNTLKRLCNKQTSGETVRCGNYGSIDHSQTLTQIQT